MKKPCAKAVIGTNNGVGEHQFNMGLAHDKDKMKVSERHKKR